MRRSGLVVVVVVGLGAHVAHADPVTLPRGTLEVAGTMELGLASRQTFQPISLAPDAHYGITDRLTLGVTTSARSLSRVEAGHGLCVRRSDHGCPRAYDNLALDARWSLRAVGSLAAAARLRLVSRSFDPWKPSVRAGALLRWRRGAFALEADPHLQLGLTNRDLGNRDQLDLPVWARVHLGKRAALWFRTGIRGELAVFTDAFAIPIGIGASVRLGRFDLGAELAFPQLLGAQNQFRSRSAHVYIETRFPR